MKKSNVHALKKKKKKKKKWKLEIDRSTLLKKKYMQF